MHFLDTAAPHRSRRRQLALAALVLAGCIFTGWGNALVARASAPPGALPPSPPVAPSLALPLRVDRGAPMQDLADSIDMLVDERGFATAGDPEGTGARWRRFEGSVAFANPNQGLPELWLRVPVDVPAGVPADRRLVIETRHVQRVRLYWQASGQPRVLLAESGLHPMAQGQVLAATSPTLDWHLGPDPAAGHLLLHLQTRVSPWGDIGLWDPLAHARSVSQRNLGLGVYFGVLAGLLLFNVLLWRVLRDRARLLYLASGLSLIGFQAATSGIGVAVLWTPLAHLNPLFIATFGPLTGASALMYVVVFLELDKGAPRLALAMKAVATGWLLVPLMLLHPQTRPAVDGLVPVVSLLTLAAFVVASVLALRWRRPGAVYFAAAWTLYGMAVLGRIMIRVQWLPQIDWIYNALYWISALEMALLAQAMAVKVRQSHQAHQDLLVRRERDNTLKAAAEQAVIDKSRFLSAVAHDIQQPFYAIGLASTVLARQPLPAAAHVPLAQIKAAVDVADELLASLALAVKLDTGLLQPHRSEVSVQPILERVESLFGPIAQQKGLQWRVNPSVERVHTDPFLLERMLCNLVANALRYTANGGVLLSCRRRGPGLLIQVWDTGPGIAAGEQDRIFGANARGSAARQGDGGMGLGLDIVRRCAAELDIGVGLRSRPGRGTCFSLLVPRTPGPARPDASAGSRAGRGRSCPPGARRSMTFQLSLSEPVANVERGDRHVDWSTH